MAIRLVLDASVMLKWALRGPNEGDREAAARILENWTDGKIEIVLPTLWAYEVGSVLGVKNPAHADELMEIYLGYSFREVELSPAIGRTTYALIRKFRVHFHDAVYHAVALAHGGILITADAAYHRRAAGAGQIRLLRNFTFPG